MSHRILFSERKREKMRCVRLSLLLRFQLKKNTKQTTHPSALFTRPRPPRAKKLHNSFADRLPISRERLIAARCILLSPDGDDNVLRVPCASLKVRHYHRVALRSSQPPPPSPRGYLFIQQTRDVQGHSHTRGRVSAARFAGHIVSRAVRLQRAILVEGTHGTAQQNRDDIEGERAGRFGGGWRVGGTWRD